MEPPVEQATAAPGERRPTSTRCRLGHHRWVNTGLFWTEHTGKRIYNYDLEYPPGGFRDWFVMRCVRCGKETLGKETRVTLS